MSCDYCQRTGEAAAATGGLGRTFSRARWSAGRTDVRAWFEERRRQGGGRPVVQAAAPPAPTLTVPRSRDFPANAVEAAPRLRDLLREHLGVTLDVSGDANNVVILREPIGHALSPEDWKRLVWVDAVPPRYSPVSAYYYGESRWRDLLRNLQARADAQDLIRGAKESWLYKDADQRALVALPDPNAEYHEVTIVLQIGHALYTATVSDLRPITSGGLSVSRFLARHLASPTAAAQELAALQARGTTHCVRCGTAQPPRRKTCPCCRKRY